MILTELEIENFRQFRGLHRFDPQTNGVVAIIGNNGAGKTTLFEAIEWCLYQPTRIRSDELPPRGDQNLRPRVKLRLSNVATGYSYEIERTLKKASAVAEVVEIHPDGERHVIATGSSTVTAYNASNLIGLSHRAFVATFFTRQKELSFFGTYKPTERRREVGRLLGLETIRTAQEAIAVERTNKRTVAASLQMQYEQESGSRDFEAERAGLLQRISEIDAEIGLRSTDVIAADSAYRDAANRYELLREEREAALRTKAQRDNLALSLKQNETDRSRIEQELERITALERERPAVAELAATVGAIGVEVDQLEVKREAFERVRSLREQTRLNSEERARIMASVQQAANLAAAPRSVGEADELARIDELLQDGASVDSSRTESHLEAMKRVASNQTAIEQLTANLDKFNQAVERFRTDIAALEVDGPADKQEAALASQRDLATRSRASLVSNDETLTATIADLRSILTHDHTSLGDSVCPTCLRSFTPAELEESRTTLQSRIDVALNQIARNKSEIAGLDTEIVDLDARAQTIRQRQTEVLQLRERILNGEAKIAETIEHRTALTSENEAIQATRALSCTITEADLERVRQQLERERSMERSRGSLVQNRETLVRLIARDAELAASLSEIGDVAFDPSDLSAARKRQDAARSALERIQFLDQQLAQRQPLSDQINALVVQRDQFSKEIVELEEILKAAPLDDASVDRASMDMESANQRVRQMQAQVEQSRRIRAEIDRDLAQIDKDQKRLSETATRADAARVEADDLDHMYREFNAFEQYVARRVRPQLEDMTSELVRVITEHKYEAIELDDDYGIKVWDGDVGSYPIEHFSGGERDVISLSARLALSRLIGSQAANPPSFMVLDEVFGSLDRERRGNVLDLLSNLAGSAESFQQLFVISHVDDVRLSPAFTEVWRVSEAADGSSRLENLNLTQGSEDI